MTRRRIVSIWLPRLAMERWCREHPDTDDGRPFALTGETAHGPVVDMTNRAARHAGVRSGQRLTDARAICPALAVGPTDRTGDAGLLRQLGHWARRWSPWTAIDGGDGLLLDSTGSDHCFGGEGAMLEEMQTRFGRLGFTCRIAIAPTIGGAWALTHFGKADRANIGHQALAQALAPLPVESLRIDESATLLLRRLGLKTVGSLASIPPAALARRFKRERGDLANPLSRLRQALGDVEEVVEPLVPQTRYRVVQRVAEPVRYVAVLEPILSDLAKRLCHLLETGCRGLRRVHFEALRIDGHVAQLEVETAAPVRTSEHVVRLFAERLDTLDAGFGFDAFALTAMWHEPIAAQQRGLEEDGEEGVALPHLLDRLRVRLGHGNVTVPIPCASHIPERSLTYRTDRTALPSVVAAECERPIRLFDQPEPVTVIYSTPDGPPRRFRWRRRLHDVARFEGPERIAPEWWREKSSVRLRDYYKIEDGEGRRFWIYRNGLLDDGRGGPPEWFMHGLFM